MRARLGGGRGGGRGAEVASGQAQFPANGATINYYLSHAATEPLTLEVLDTTGAILRSYTSEASRQPTTESPTPSSDDEAPPAFRRAPPIRLTTSAGMNRLIWDFNDADGIMVPPGTYRVKLAAGTWSATQPLVLTIDPRLAADGITAADLREQFDHNRRMRDLVTEVGRVATRVRQARTRLQTSAPSDSLTKVETLAVTLFGPDEGVRYGRPGLQTQITYLAGMTTRADQRVGRDAVDRYRELRKQLTALEQRVNTTLGADR